MEKLNSSSLIGQAELESLAPRPRQVIISTLLSSKPRELAFLWTAFITLLMALISLFVWQQVFGIQELVIATPENIFSSQQWYRAWTTLFVHANEKHLLSNSFLFFILGSLTASYFSYVSFPAMGIFFGGITNLIVLGSMPVQSSLVGASGIVFWLGGVWLTLYFLIDVKRSRYQRLIRSMGVAIMLFFPAETFDPQVSYEAHFVGFGLGVLYALGYYHFNKNKITKAIKYKTVFD